MSAARGPRVSLEAVMWTYPALDGVCGAVRRVTRCKLSRGKKMLSEMNDFDTPDIERSKYFVYHTLWS